MKRKSKLLYLIICIIVSCVSFLPTTKVSAASSATYNMEKNEKTYKDKDDTTVRGVVYFYYPQLIGNTTAIKKINTVLKNAADDFMKSESAKSLEEYVTGSIENDGFYSETEQYYYMAACKVTYNSKNVISIHMKEMWYAGGVYNQMDYGFTFDLKTGKELSIVDVVSGNSSTVKNKIVNAGTKYLKKLLGSNFNNDYPNVLPIIKDYSVKKCNYYLTPGKAHICFGSYELGLGNCWNSFSLASEYK
ncbi:MAG TPA: DUF4163 domain-containing protein [Lachnospiraceae bacterium]|nr:DUF4163 domain-containing protein [Lachnospiraceae bacterium]